MFHPAACVLSWLVLLMAVQVLSWPALLAIAAVLAVAGGEVCRRWWHLARRARWLLLTLWLILAYGSPGEVLFDLAWLPTDAGVADAGLHVLRLLVMLGALAWLFARVPREDILGGLWTLAAPLRHAGCDVARAVVRLSLVFDIVQEAPKPGNWRQLLEEGATPAHAAATVRLSLPPWRLADGALVAAFFLALLGACWLP